jgi:hypothetical protein
MKSISKINIFYTFALKIVTYLLSNPTYISCILNISLINLNIHLGALKFHVIVVAINWLVMQLMRYVKLYLDESNPKTHPIKRMKKPLIVTLSQK